VTTSIQSVDIKTRNLYYMMARLTAVQFGVVGRRVYDCLMRRNAVAAGTSTLFQRMCCSPLSNRIARKVYTPYQRCLRQILDSSTGWNKPNENFIIRYRIAYKQVYVGSLLCECIFLSRHFLTLTLIVQYYDRCFV